MHIFLISNDQDTYVGFRLCGIEGVVVSTTEELLAQLDLAVNNPEIGVLLINEKLAEDVREKLDYIKLTMPHPLIVEVPDRNGSIRPDDFITSYVKEAIGISI